MTGRPDHSRLTHWQGEPVHVWEAAWGVPGFEPWDRLGSTNDRARELAAHGAPAFTVVTAEEQLEGRGRSGRRWLSPPGRGLWMSVVLRPPVPAALPLTPLLVGLAVCRGIEAVLEEVEVGVKWPNDLLVAGRKVCGILCEAGSDDAVVAGIGLNVRQSTEDFPPELRESAVSLEGASGRPVDRGRIAGAILASLRTLFARPTMRLEGPTGEAMARRDVLRGRVVRVEDGPEGIARGMGARGELLIEVEPDHVEVVRAGTVRIAEGGERRSEGPGVALDGADVTASGET